ncbi:amidohydrolase [Agromyces rhizosphaerae]|uniref:Amidohydrolase n=1 Tax=Agromyces rhizosphaerae TaxID=88374 RepID=A0A9W6CUZ5_9MICO|nr:amidohydrolase family protein [Agromyces rhizosphaerae]GLI26952.1 amidohydrolase [Agromyces rhizosphaerae]
MKVIALEEHMFPRDLIESEQLDFGLRAGAKIPDLDELDEGRLRIMDEAGIDVQVLSALGWLVQNLEPARSVPLSRELNARLAAAVSRHPDRYRAFASLSMTAPRDAAAELARCVEELGFVGAMIHGQTDGVFLDDPSVRPVLETASRLGVPVYLHPAPPPTTVLDAYYSNLSPAVQACLSTSGWGWHSECGMHVLRMVAAGVFEELPDLTVIVGHMGEGLPFHLDRIQDMLGPVVTGHSLTVADTLRRNVYLTTSGYFSDAPLECALSTFGADHVLFSVDHPFASSSRATAHLRDAPLTPSDREKIAHENAEALLSI